MRYVGAVILVSLVAGFAVTFYSLTYLLSINQQHYLVTESQKKSWIADNCYQAWTFDEWIAMKKAGKAPTSDRPMLSGYIFEAYTFQDTKYNCKTDVPYWVKQPSIWWGWW